jgi:kynurenine formamidase
MKIIDLSYEITVDIPMYPGIASPVFNEEFTVEKSGFFERKITMFSHTGTHIDAPAHMIKDGKTLDNYGIDHFFGKAFMLDLSQKNINTIGLDTVKRFEEDLKNVDFLIIKTGWKKYWGQDIFFKDYPVLSLESANWLKRFNLKGIGLDTVSADSFDSVRFPVHKSLLGNDTLIVENLNNLDKLKESIFDISVFPLNIKGAGGSPIRAVAFI